MTPPLDDGLDFSGYPQPPDVPPDPSGNDWQGPPGEQGIPGPPGPMPPGGPFLPISGGTVMAHLTGTTQDDALTISSTAVGSGVNGPTTAQVGMTIDHQKDGWYSGTSAVGEVDGLSIVVRQGGANSDMSGMLVNIARTTAGYMSAIEWVAQEQQINTGAPLYSMRAQFGSMNAVTANRFGHILSADVGNMTSAFMTINTAGQGYWGNIFSNTKDNVQNFVITDDGGINTAGTILINSAGTGVLRVQGHATPTTSGVNVMWNLGAGGLSGGAYILNNPGGGTGGFIFGSVNDAGTVTARQIIDSNGNHTFVGNAVVGGNVTVYNGEVFLRSDNGLGLRWASNQFQFEVSGSPVGYVSSGGAGYFNGVVTAAGGEVYLRNDNAIGLRWASNQFQFDIGGSAVAAFNNSGYLFNNGIQVVGYHITGWAAPTGTATRTTFATGSVTLPLLAERVKALIDDLTTHGLIGA